MLPVLGGEEGERGGKAKERIIGPLEDWSEVSSAEAKGTLNKTKTRRKLAKKNIRRIFYPS